MGEVTTPFDAMTTAGSTVFLLACQLTFFTAMGTLIILTVAYSLGYSLLFFMPLLRVAGPEGRVGDVCRLPDLASKCAITAAPARVGPSF